MTAEPVSLPERSNSKRPDTYQNPSSVDEVVDTVEDKLKPNKPFT